MVTFVNVDKSENLLPHVIVQICLMCIALLNVLDAFVSHPRHYDKMTYIINALSITIIVIIIIIDEIQFLIYAIKSVKGRMETYWSPEWGTAKAPRFRI